MFATPVHTLSLFNQALVGVATFAEVALVGAVDAVVHVITHQVVVDTVGGLGAPELAALTAPAI